MSDSLSNSDAGPPVPLDVFADTLRPRTVDGNMVPGSPDEVWIQLLRIRHGNERRSLSYWQSLITLYRSQPAHPADPAFVKGE